MSLKKPQNEGFTLVELLIVVAIIGIIAAIAIPNLLSAIQRGKQKRTMGDLKTIASALEQYNTDSNTYPAQAIGSVSGIMTTTYLTAGYLTTPIYKDGWWAAAAPTANIIQYVSGTSAQDYMLGSFAKGNAANGGNRAILATITNFLGGTQVDSTTFDCDVVIVDGQFAQAPNGKQYSAGTGC